MGHNLIVKSFYLYKVIRAIIQDIEHVEQNFKVITCCTISTGHIYYNKHDGIKVEMTMTKQKFQKMPNLVINQNRVVDDIFRDFTHILPN